MVDSVHACTRCGSRSKPITTSLVVVDGPMKDVCPQLNLCELCTESLARWMDRKKSHRHRSSSGRSQSSHSEASSSRRSERSSDPFEDSPDDDPDEESDEPRARVAGGSLSEKFGGGQLGQSLGEMTVRSLVTHPAFLYTCLFIMALVLAGVLLYSLKSGPVEPSLPG